VKAASSYLRSSSSAYGDTLPGCIIGIYRHTLGADSPAPDKAGMMYSDQTDKRGESHDDQWNLMDKREEHYPVTFRRRLVISCIT
jgi:hypothetical protein